jgi:transketolase
LISQRDAFISRLFERARKDKDIYLMSADMGAPALDRWRKELPEQFFATGISEQNTINFAAGLSAAGKKVYVYFMAAWAARCYEQVRYSCAIANNPITILGTGVGLGYSPAGPAHNPTEDIAYMRALCGIEIYSPCNSEVAAKLADLTCDQPKLRYIRLERTSATELENMSYSLETIESGAVCLKSEYRKKPRICIISSGYMLGRALKAAAIIKDYDIAVADLFRVKPIDNAVFKELVKNYDHIITLEEQTLSGGLGSAVCEALTGLGLKKEVLRIGLPEGYIFQNATRDYLLDNNGLSVETICEQINKFIK